MEKFADWVIEHRKRLLVVCTLVALVLLSFVPTMKLDDQFVEYFSERIEVRRDSEFTVDNLTGLYQVQFSVTADGPEGVADPEYLEALDDFASWYRSQPGVAHVATFSDTMKRLSMNMHGDDRSWYRVPGERPLAAQYAIFPNPPCWNSSIICGHFARSAYWGAQLCLWLSSPAAGQMFTMRKISCYGTLRRDALLFRRREVTLT